MDPVQIAKIVAGMIGAISFMILFVKAMDARARRKANGLSKQSPKEKISEEEIRGRYREALEKIVTARLQKESSTESGEPVFLSHYINKSRLRHWVLHVHSHKYELRQRVADDPNTKAQYAAAIAPSDFDLEAYQRSVTIHHSPEVGNYFYSMIGWTTLSKEKVDEKCYQVSASFGNYDLLSNNCQNFLQRLADDIITTKAPDWDWFRHHDVVGYRYIEQPLDFHVISAATWSKQLTETKHLLSTDEQQKIDEFLLILEDIVDTNLRQRITLENTNSMSMNATVNADGGGQYDTGQHHDSDGNHDGGGGGGEYLTDLIN